MSAQTKYAAMSRRAAMTAAALAAMATLTGCSGGGAGDVATGDMALGAPEGAKVTVVEYASVTCVHCAAWHKNTWPAFKAAYIDTNKVRFVFRELPTPPTNVAVAGFMIARCAGDDKYFDVIYNIMSSQEEWRVGVNPRDTLFRVGNGAGLNNQQIEACIKNPDNLKAAEARSEAAMRAGVTGTPAFFVNGVSVVSPGSEGASMADLSRAIDAELAKG